MASDTSVFVSIRRMDPRGVESWSSRDFAQALGYTDYRNFEAVLAKAKTACASSGQTVADHFVDITEMVQIGSGATRAVKTTLLSRYACYLAIQNADPAKPRVALGQTYFAVQTKANANRTHREVGAKVRQTIQELGGTMPEDLPTAESIKLLDARRKKMLSDE